MSAEVISETQQRFLRAILEQVPLERVAELYRFAPIRQGGSETGLAVFATWPEPPAVELVVDESEVEAVAAADVDAAAGVGGADEGALAADVNVEVEAESAETSQDESLEAAVEPASAEAVEGQVQLASAETLEEQAPETVVEPASEEKMEAAAEEASAESAAGSAGEAQNAEPLVPEGRQRVRHTVFTARYHLVLKGPERGKWELDIREEADAPLVTVDAVVRGVQRRAGDPAEVERMTPHQLAVAVSDTPWKVNESGPEAEQSA